MAARLAHPELWLGLLIMAGLVDDIYDGILSRRWGTDTNALRIADSAADTVFYLCILAAIIDLDWLVLRDRMVLVAALLGLEVTRWVFDWIKFRRMASYHSYTSKLWSILLAIAVVALLCFHRAFWLVTLALSWGIWCDLEGLAMSILLPVWTRDVKNLAVAWSLRQQIKASTEVTENQTSLPSR